MNIEKDKLRELVRKNYAEIAKGNVSSCCCTPGGGGSCCSPGAASLDLGYSPVDLDSVPEESNLGLGCGNPRAIASLKKGEVVLDLGSGAGFDCFLAAEAVGDTGRVIGVDMTPEMINKARQNAATSGIGHVEFRLGEIENLPVADQQVDVIISNCVINLSPEKRRVFQEAFRVLKNGGRLAISDVVATAPLPESIREDLKLYSGCIAGAELITDIEQMLQEAGFTDIKIEPVDESRIFIRDWAPGTASEDYVVSAAIQAIKPTME